MGVKRGFTRRVRARYSRCHDARIPRSALSRRLRRQGASFRADHLFRGHRCLRHRLLRQLSEVHGAGAVGHDPRRRSRSGGRAPRERERLCGGRGRHPLPPARPARRRSSGDQHSRSGPRILGLHSAASHARTGTVDRRALDGGLPRPRGTAAAAADRLGREVQGGHRLSPMFSRMQRFLWMVAAAAIGAAAHAQQPGTAAATVVAAPPLSTPSDKPTSAGGTLSLAWQASKLIAQDLRTTSEIVPLPPQQKDYYSYPEVTAPTFSRWRAAGAKMLVTGFVQARSDDRVTFGCYVYDVDKGREVGRKGFVVAPGEWSRAAHKCSGLAYAAV